MLSFRASQGLSGSGRRLQPRGLVSTLALFVNTVLFGLGSPLAHAGSTASPEAGEVNETARMTGSSGADQADLAGLNSIERELRSSLELTVSEAGPTSPWVVQLTNVGSRNVRLAADARLLGFEIQVPGRKKPEVCRIPKEMRPADTDAAPSLDLAPRQSFTFRIDPRFYCFEEGEQSMLVPGAQLTPTFGWTEATKSVWQKGQRVEVRLEQTAPFVAQLSPPGPQPLATTEQRSRESTAHTEGATSEARGSAPDVDSAEHGANQDALLQPQLGLKQVEGGAIALGSEYRSWAPPELSSADRVARKLPPLDLEITQGSDSLTARNARVTVSLTNRGPTPNTVFFRREHLTFMLLGPDGVARCAAPDEDRAPDAQEFTRLGVGKRVDFVTQILEFCDTSLLDRPGFYLVAAEANLTEDGSAAQLKAYTGKLFSTRLRPLRVRTGSAPFVFSEFMTLAEARKRLEVPKRVSGRKPTEAIGGPFRQAPGGGAVGNVPTQQQEAPMPPAEQVPPPPPPPPTEDGT